MKNKKIIITGFMGTGKTAVGKILASRLKWLFFDTDALAENAEGLTVTEIFETKGEPYFRSLEKRCFEGLVTLNEVVIATGGGTLLDPEAQTLASQDATVICLNASQEELQKRLLRDKTRPLTKLGFNALMDLLKEREQFYDGIKFQFDTTGQTPEVVSNTIFETLGLDRLA